MTGLEVLGLNTESRICALDEWAVLVELDICTLDVEVYGLFKAVGYW